MSAQTIDDVVAILDSIIANAIRDQSPLGLFPAMYRQITLRVRARLAAGFFDNATLMSTFASQFANRYIIALEQYHNNQEPTRAWTVAFEATRTPDHLIAQHLLLGMNAHINLDLAIVTAEIAESTTGLTELQADYNRINLVLADILDAIQQQLDEFSPWLDILDRVGGRTDEALINFSLDKARQAAWEQAQQLVQQSPSQRQQAITELDRKTAFLGRLIAEPGHLLGKAVDLIHRAEEKDVAVIIRGLDQIVANLPA